MAFYCFVLVSKLILSFFWLCIWFVGGFEGLSGVSGFVESRFVFCFCEIGFRVAGK